jgi:hypothetical protein
MDLHQIPASHQPSTPPHRGQAREAEADTEGEADTEAAANATGATSETVLPKKDDSDHDEDSIFTTAPEQPLAADEPYPVDDATQQNTPPEAKRSRGRTALIMSALCVRFH